VCHAIEIDPIYVDVAILRWQAFTGQSVTLDGSDASFADVALRGARMAKTDEPPR
jgi:hypothetical protein